MADVTTAEQRWEKVVGDFRQLCILRRQKKWIESDMILNSDLPRSIASWSEIFDGQPAAKKSRLDAMFQAWGLAPRWWLRLRVMLTVVVLGCLAIPLQA